MRNSIKKLTLVLLAALLPLGLAGCGAGDAGVAGGSGTDTLPPTVYVKTGTLATDSWGYTGYNPVQLEAPAETKVVLSERTLLLDAERVVVSGTNATKVTYSSDFTTLSSSVQASAPGQLVGYVDVAVGDATTANPAYSITVDAGSVAAGTTVGIYSYDDSTRRWKAVTTAVVSGTGKVTFNAGEFGLWGVFR